MSSGAVVAEEAPSSEIADKLGPGGGLLHYDSNEYRCNYCTGFTTPSTVLLEEHIRLHHESEDIETECEVPLLWGFSIAEEELLEEMGAGREGLAGAPGAKRGNAAAGAAAPLELVTGRRRRAKNRVGKKKRYRCPWCDFETHHPGSIAQHKKRHTGERPYACDECDYRAARSSLLAQHKMRHTGERPFACDQCDYRASRSSLLAQHRLRHTGVKPYVCDLCGYRAAQSGLLAQHRRRHTGEKPYACSACGFRTARSAYLRQHMLSHLQPV